MFFYTLGFFHKSLFNLFLIYKLNTLIKVKNSNIMGVIKIPLISQFYGILIYIYKEIGGHHHEPHIHVRYNEFELSMSLNGVVIEGNLPNKQMKLLQAWYELHQDELRASYYNYNENGEIIKIKGLE